MDPILEKVLRPEIVWVFIPVTAILLWGVAGIIRALRGEPGDFEEWKNELKELRTRVERLEQARHGTPLGETTPHLPGPSA
jgi:hypothetical protein